MPLEPGVSQALERLGGYAESHVVFQALRLGLFDEFTPPSTCSQIATRRGWDRDVLQSLLDFLTRSGHVTRDDAKRYELTEVGQGCIAYRGWYELLVGGYQSTLKAFDRLLSSGPDETKRDLYWVAVGSGHISIYDAIPLLQELVESLDVVPRKVVDLGCGNAQYLVRYATMFPEARIVGCDESKDAVRAARVQVREAGLTSRIEVRQRGVEDFDFDADEDLIVMAFVLHEVLGQSGVPGVRRLLRKIRTRAPQARLVVIEVEPPSVEEPPLSPEFRGYYNLYALLQTLTAQRLASSEFWVEEFRQAGYDIRDRGTVRQSIDSTELEQGFLLAPRLNN